VGRSLRPPLGPACSAIKAGVKKRFMSPVPRLMDCCVKR